MPTPFEDMTGDTDLDTEGFKAYLDEAVPKFYVFYTEAQKTSPNEFQSAMTKTEWMEEFNAYVETLDGNNDGGEDAS